MMSSKIIQWPCLLQGRPRPPNCGELEARLLQGSVATRAPPCWDSWVVWPLPRPLGPFGDSALQRRYLKSSSYCGPLRQRCILVSAVSAVL